VTPTASKGIAFAWGQEGNTEGYVSSADFPLNLIIENSPVFITITFDCPGVSNGTIRFYVNGINYSTHTSQTGPMQALWTNSQYSGILFHIGNRAIGTYTYDTDMVQSIAHVAIWKRVLDAGTIMDLYRAGSTHPSIKFHK
jgi:hypothetical protein